MNIVEHAKIFAICRHNGQKDDCGEDYFISHLDPVVKILEIITSDEEILSAGYLHDIIEDTNTTYEELCTEFNKQIADLVMEVTHEGKKDQHGLYFPRLQSKKAIIIKFADRLSNISRMNAWSEKRQEHYLKKSKFWKEEEQEQVRGYDLIKNMSSWKITMPIFSQIFDGGMNPEDFMGLIKGLAKADYVIFGMPDEQQERKRGITIQVYAPKKVMLRWQDQIRSYGIRVEQTEKF